jgi:hypothetical protein
MYVVYVKVDLRFDFFSQRVAVDLKHIDASTHQKSLSRTGGMEQKGEIRGATHLGSGEHKHGMLLLPAGEVAGGRFLGTSCDQHTPAYGSTGE